MYNKRMKSTLNRLEEITKQAVDCSCVVVVYKSKEGSWRGFAHPYNITIEATTKLKALNAVKDMVEAYEESLKRHDFPVNLRSKHLLNEQDSEFFNKLALNSLFDKGSLTGSNYYAETQALS